MSLCALLLLSDLVFLHSPASTRAESGDPVLLPDPNTRDIPRGLSEGSIPLGRTEIRVPILMYHYIRDVPPSASQLSFNLSVTPADFNLQMKWLHLNHYHAITFDDLRAYFAGLQSLPSKPVIITLDDGYRDLFTTAYPILRAYNFVAVAYIVTGFVGHPRYVTSDMIVQMDHDGIEIASHTVDHVDLKRAALPSVTYEVVQAKRWLENLVGHPVVDFAYPSGEFDAAVESELAAAGYNTAVTELPGTEHAWATRYAWTRVRVAGGESLVTFIKNLGLVEPYVFAPATA